MNRKSGTLKIGISDNWGSLVPSLQHTAFGDALLSNQFESLVRRGQGGVTLPSLAKSWSVNANYTIYEFEIDTEKTFSNGERLTAQHFKNAWEHGLSLKPTSSNSSLQDMLHLIKGFDKFASTKHLEGIVVNSNNKLTIHFDKPFRTALWGFAAGRMAVYIEDKNKFYGTGPYIINSQTEKHIHFVANPKYNGKANFENIEVDIVDPNKAKESLSQGDVNLYLFAEKTNAVDCGHSDEKISCFIGMETRHLVLYLNGLSGRIFSNPKYRLAIQSIVYKSIHHDNFPPNHQISTDLDSQSFLKLQQGRLSDENAKQIIMAGEKYENEFINATQKTPIYFISPEKQNWIQPILEKQGVRFEERSGLVAFKDFLSKYYKTFEPDILVGTPSITSGDPDGIFHLLGKDGSITSPIIFRKSVADALESGRVLVSFGQIAPHYQQVASEILTEVPYVHIGFIKGLIAYNKETLEINKQVKDRDNDSFDLFLPR